MIKFNIKHKNSLIFKRLFFSNEFKSHERIGAHNLDVISIIVGCLFSNAYMEKRTKGTRIIFELCNKNVQYIIWLHKFFISRGYCSSSRKKLYTKINKNNEVSFRYSFKTYTFSSFNWLYDMFYKKGVIIITLDEYLIPLVLFAWFINGGKNSNKIVFNISDENLEYLCYIITNKHNLNNMIYLTEGSNIFTTEKFLFSVFNKKIKLDLLSWCILDDNYKVLYNNNNNFANVDKKFCDNIIQYSTKTENCIKYTVKYKNQYYLNIIQEQVIIGILLGDGFLERNKFNHNTRLRIEQSYPEKEEYLNSLFTIFEPLTGMTPVVVIRKADKRIGTITKSLYFRTLSMPCLNYYYELFYRNKIKQVPKNLDKLLTARGLAYWIMDDGSKSVYNQTIIHTRSFIKKDVIFIQNVLMKNFSLTTRIEEKKKDQWVIFIPVKQKVKLKDIVGSYMHNSMLYKIL